MSRLVRCAVSFAIVSVAYSIYALVAVPLIEPSIADSTGASAEGNPFEPAFDQRIKQLEGLFPPDAWELKDPKILENDKIKLLLKDYKNLGDGRVELHPCTMVFLWDGPAEDEAQRKRQSVILEAPQGAILKFDKPIDLRSLKIGRLVGGYLLGPITIRSQGKLPGPEDDLLIHTRDLQLNERKVWTPHPVDFTWGKHSGRGRDMHIKLLAGPDQTGQDLSAPNVAGVEVFEIRHLERLHLETTSPPGNTTAPGAARADRGGDLFNPAGAGDLSVDITCLGPFSFNVPKRVATFTKQVDVVRSNASGPSDQIQGDLLSIYFAPRATSQPASDNLPDLEPERIEMRGYPVIVNAPSQDLKAQGERLEYNLKTNLIGLDGGPEVYLRQGPNEIHGRSLQYQSLGPGRLGRAAAQGPGRLRAQMAGKPDEQLEARWNGQLRLEPQEQEHLISFNGGAILEYAGIGRLEAEEIFFWLKEAPPGAPADQPRLRGDRMMARNQVNLQSPQLSVAVEQLEVWFEQKDAPQGIRWKAAGEDETAPTMPGANVNAISAVNQSRAVSARSAVPAQGNAPQQHFKINGRILRARIQLEDQQSALAELMIEEGVRLEETQTLDPQERPVLITGDRLHAVNVSLPSAALNVTGRPAHFEGRGLGLTGASINLNRGENLLWINGPGRMDLPLQGNSLGQSLVPGQAASMPGTLLVEWKKSMVFDGRTAKFQDSASATMPQQHLQTDVMEVKLKRPVSFADAKLSDQNQPEVEELLCHGGVLLENRSLDARQQLLSNDLLQVADLAVNLQTGALSAGGPGWLNSVRFGSSDLLKNPLAPGQDDQRPLMPVSNNGPAQGSEKPQLNCLHVRFEDSITGNLLQRELVFHEQIRAAYAPVADWTAMLDPDRPELLGPQAITLHCIHLKVNQMPTPGSDAQTIEFEAAGNAVVEGGIFTARALRITYAEAKDLLILEGDGRTDAQFFRQSQPGAKADEFAARKILYWPKTNRLNVEGARSLEINQGKK